MNRMKVSVSNGKYTFEGLDLVRIDVSRHGEPWVADVRPLNAIHSMMCELDAARVVLAAVRDILKPGAELGETTPRERLEAALARHRALVDDIEQPSAWAAPAGGAG